jgi:cystathionine beta-lyase/cystathionine gamma-synthase
MQIKKQTKLLQADIDSVDIDAFKSAFDDCRASLFEYHKSALKQQQLEAQNQIEETNESEKQFYISLIQTTEQKEYQQKIAELERLRSAKLTSLKLVLKLSL